MQGLIELYQMISMNDDRLSDSEKRALLKARLAIQMFERAMRELREIQPGRTAGK